MKNIMFLGGLLLSAMTFVACSDDYTDWADPQSNPQEEAVTLPGYKASGTSSVDLADVTGDSVQVLSLSAVSLPEGSVVGNTRVELLPADGSSTTAVTVDVDNEGRVGKADLQAVLESFYGKRPTERSLSGHVYSNIITNGQAFLVDAGTITVTATPEAPYIADAYYLVGDVTGGWDADHVVKFNHSGADVYEDPVFTVSFTAAAGNCWQIIPQGNIDNDDFWHKGADGVVGVATDGDTSLEGTLVATESVGAGKIENAGMYRMTINMLDYTYTIEPMAATYYLVGDLQGWSDSNRSCALYPETATVQSYTTQWNGAGNLKIWDSTNFGNWDVAYGAAVDGDNSPSGSLVNSGAGAIVVPVIGEYYTFTADFSNMTYTWTRLDNQNPATHAFVGITGGFSGWNEGIAMTPVENSPHNWMITYTFTNDDEMKFRDGNTWWGNSTDGGNITVSAGTYNIYFNDITGQYLFIAQ